jgi:hypothetical protein
MKSDIGTIFENMSRISKFHSNLTRIKGTLPEDHYSYIKISGSLLLRKRNISDKFVEKTKH